jgi:fermentation-respiration switch protein FrsA (DUF1100 family)
MAGPRWVRLDVDYFRNPKMQAVGLRGRALHLAGVCYCAAQLTDGHIPDVAVAGLLADAHVPRSTVRALTDAALWIRVEDGYLVHDFVEMNGTKAEVMGRVEAAKKRKLKWMQTHKEP